MVAAQVVLTSLGVAAVHLPGPLAWTVLLVSAGILAVLVVGRGFLTPDGPSPEGLHP